MKMKPFNLEEAKAGKPLCYPDGTPAKLLAYFPESSDPHQKCVIGRMYSDSSGSVLTCSETGEFAPDGKYMETMNVYMALEPDMNVADILRHLVLSPEVQGEYDRICAKNPETVDDQEGRFLQRFEQALAALKKSECERGRSKDWTAEDDHRQEIISEGRLP